MNDFDYDVMQRKNLASQAKHRKRGSKSKKCTLPSDGMTNKQWKERNGEVMTYDLSKPMKWTKFKYMPADLQREYLEKLRDEHGALQKDVAAMLGITPNSFSNYVRAHGISIFGHGGRGVATEEARWQAFLLGEMAECAEDAQPAVESTTPTDGEQPEKKEATAMQMDSFTLRFSGEFDPDTIRNSLATLLDKGQRVSVEIRCTIDAAEG